MIEGAPPLVSFVVLSYNFSRFLRVCLDSILAQRGDYPFEVVVVDDASTDGSAELVRSYADPRIRLLAHATNLGHATTVRDGLVASRGDFLARIDGDDRIRPSFLQEQVPVLQRCLSVGLVHGVAALMDENGVVQEPPPGSLQPERPANEFVRLLETNFICAPTVLARRAAWLRALPVPPDLAFHDWYFTLQIARRSDFYPVARVVADYRVHPGNMHTRTARSGQEEQSVFWLLDKLYAEQEAMPALEAAKRRARCRVYAAHYLDAADKYFQFGMDSDARRCYLAALRHRPVLLLRPGVIRRLGATLTSRALYDRFKSAWKSAQPNRRYKSR